jgi:response regulator RpfG family c-di-GMP phosphodiesterase/signal transduction histidine kinase
LKNKIHPDSNTILKEKISIIKEISSAITSTSSLDSITNLILDLALSYTKARSGSILLLDKHGELVINAARGIDTDIIQTIRVKVGDYICGKVAQERAPLLVKDINKSKQINMKQKEKYNTKSFICCPILMKDKLLGVININNKISGTPFTEDELDLINILANQAAIALEDTRLISELNSTASALDESNKGLINTDRLRTEFIAKIAHELRTPLNSLKGALYYLKGKKPLEIEQKEFIDILSDETEHLINLLHGLFDFYPLGNRETMQNKRVLSLKDILDEAIATRIVRDTLATKNIAIKINGPKSIPDIIGEKTSLFHSVINIIDGLAEYSTPRHEMEIQVINRRNAVKINFLSKGSKIPATSLPLFFDERSAWYGVDADKNKLKFYLAKKTVDMHKGTINAVNTQKGLSIQLTFPINQIEYRNAITDEMADLFLAFISESMNLNRCSIMLLNSATNKLTIKNAIGIDEKTVRETSVKVGDSISGWVAAEGKPLFIKNVEKDSRIREKNRTQYNTKSLLCLPIILNKKTIGVLNLTNKSDGADFNIKDLYMASVIADRISHIIKKVQKIDMRTNGFKTIVKETEALINAEKLYKKKNGHVTDLVFSIMQNMNKVEDEIKLAVYSSKLYDLGITQIDENITLKSTKLSDIEKKIIKTHPFPGVKLIDSLEHDERVKNIVLHHHENYDGTGYPSGLRGNKIPFISRVLAVADTYTAMVSDRPYRKALSKKIAINQIKAGAGMQFDPKVVEAFTQVV